MNVFNGSFCFNLSFKPRSPFSEWCSYAAIAEGLTFGSKVEDVRNKHLRDALLVTEDVIGTICPCDTAAYRALDFAEHQRDTIDEENDIKALASLCAGFGIHPLIGNHAVVVLHVFVIEEGNRDVIAILSERITILLEYEFLESLVGGNQIMGLNGLHSRPEPIDDLFGLIWCHTFIEAKDGILQPAANQHVLHVTGNAVGRDIFPAYLLGDLNEGFFNGIFCKHIVVCFNSNTLIYRPV